VLSRLHKTLGGWGTAQTPVESIQHSSSPLQLLQQLPAELFRYHFSFIPLGLRTGTYSGDGGELAVPSLNSAKIGFGTP